MKKILRKLIALMITALIVLSTLPVIIFAATTTDIYTVQKGDTLWKISKKYKVGISEIISANPQFNDPDLIYPGDKVTIPLSDESSKSIEEQVVELINKERIKKGLNPLVLNWEVSRVARYKSNDMRDSNYFDHQSPIYGSPFEMLKKFNISYQSAGENIGKGQKTAKAIVDSWMASEGHRKNILSSGFTEIGVGYSEGRSTTYWTQIFITS